MKKPYRSIRFNDERKWKRKHPLDDILQVGSQKAMGYVCETTDDEDHFRENLIKVKKSLSETGKLVYYKRRTKGWLPILYVGDKDMMQSILDRHKDILIEAGWDTDAELVFAKIYGEHIDHHKNKRLYHLIAKLFNSWCLFCESPIKNPSGGPLLSSHPYDPDEK